MNRATPNPPISIHTGNSRFDQANSTDETKVPCTSLAGMLLKPVKCETMIQKSTHSPVDRSKLGERFTLEYKPHLYMTDYSRELAEEGELHKRFETKIKQELAMTEEEAERDFNSRLRVKNVGYGYKADDSYGIFAKKDIQKNSYIGMLSGSVTAYSSSFTSGKFQDASLVRIVAAEFSKPDDLETATKALLEYQKVLPDHQHHVRALMKSLKETPDSDQRTVIKYRCYYPVKKAGSEVIITPEDSRLTPMHLMNTGESTNTDLKLVKVLTSNKRSSFPVLAMYSTKHIRAGEELTWEYQLTEKSEAGDFRDARTDLKGVTLDFANIMKNHKELRKLVPDCLPETQYPDPPQVHDVSQEVFDKRKTL